MAVQLRGIAQRHLGSEENLYPSERRRKKKRFWSQTTNKILKLISNLVEIIIEKCNKIVNVTMKLWNYYLDGGKVTITDDRTLTNLDVCVRSRMLEWKSRQSWISWCYKFSNINADPRDFSPNTNSNRADEIAFWFTWCVCVC